MSIGGVFLGGKAGCWRGDEAKGFEDAVPDARGTSPNMVESCCTSLVSAGIVFVRALNCLERVRAAGPTLLGRISSSVSVSTIKEETGAISSCPIPSIIIKEGVGCKREG